MSKSEAINIDSIRHSGEFIPHSQLPTYVRTARETVAAHAKEVPESFVSYSDAPKVIRQANISPGSQDLLIGFIKLAQLQQFTGGFGFNYDALYKKAVRPEYTSGHVQETGDYLKKREVDFLVVPGFSGHAIGAQYAEAAGVPALLLTKEEPEEDGTFPIGSFCIPSYTGNKNVVIHPSILATRGIFDDLYARQFEEQKDEKKVTLKVRGGGADDIQDHGTMFKALADSARIITEVEAARIVAEYRKTTGDNREIDLDFNIAALVTPLKKVYNKGDEELERKFGITSQAGINVTHIYPQQNVITVEGVGNIQMKKA